MKRTLMTAALLSTFAAASAFGVPGGWLHDGMGGGMMHGPGMGYGMMNGAGWGPKNCHFDVAAPDLNLSSEQRAKLEDIRRDLWRKQSEIAGRMHAQDVHMHDLYSFGMDEALARKSFDAMTAAHKEMLELALEANRRASAVLTDEQRKRLRQAREGGGS